MAGPPATGILTGSCHCSRLALARGALRCCLAVFVCCSFPDAAQMHACSCQLIPAATIAAAAGVAAAAACTDHRPDGPRDPGPCFCLPRHRSGAGVCRAGTAASLHAVVQSPLLDSPHMAVPAGGGKRTGTAAARHGRSRCPTVDPGDLQPTQIARPADCGGQASVTAAPIRTTDWSLRKWGGWVNG